MGENLVTADLEKAMRAAVIARGVVCIVAHLPRIAHAITAILQFHAVIAAAITRESVSIIANLVFVSIPIPTRLLGEAVLAAAIARFVIPVIADFAGVDHAVPAVLEDSAVTAAIIAILDIAVVAHLAGFAIHHAIAAAIANAYTLGLRALKAGGAAPVIVARNGRCTAKGAREGGAGPRDGDR